MKIQVKRFGDILSSRPEMREAALILLANELRGYDRKIEIDFEDVLVMTPSWLGEFINTLRPQISEISFLHTENASVSESIKIIESSENQ